MQLHHDGNLFLWVWQLFLAKMTIKRINKPVSVMTSGVRLGHHPEPAQGHWGIHKGWEPDAGWKLHHCCWTRGQVSACIFFLHPSVWKLSYILTFDANYSSGFYGLHLPRFMRNLLIVVLWVEAWSVNTNWFIICSLLLPASGYKIKCDLLKRFMCVRLILEGQCCFRAVQQVLVEARLLAS